MRWLLLILGLAVAFVAGLALLEGFEESPPKSPADFMEPADPSGEHEEIDEDSREQLREILRNAGNEDDTNR